MHIAKPFPAQTDRVGPVSSLHSRKQARAFAATVAALVSVIMSAPVGQAATGTWLSNAVGNWSDTTKWTSGTIADGATFTANINTDINNTRLVTLDSSRIIGILNIGDTNRSNSYNLATGANVLTFDNGAANGQLNQVNQSFGDTISGNLAIAGNGNLTITNASTTALPLTISAGITSALGTGTQTLAFNNANAVVVSGNIENGATGGSIALTKNSAGLVTLSGTNTYTGGTTITEGGIRFNSAASIGGTGANVSVASAGIAGFGFALDQATLSGRIVADSTGTIALAANTANNLDFGAAGLTKLSLGAVTGTTATYSGTVWTPVDNVYRLGGGGGTLVFDPALTGAGNSLIVGGKGTGGTVTLTNAATYGGGTVVNSGNTLQTNVLAGVSTTPFGTGPITLKNGAIGLGTAAVLPNNSQVTASGYDVTYQGVGEIKLAHGTGAGSFVTFTANSLTRVGDSVLYISAAPTSSLVGLGFNEKVFVTNGAPTQLTNGMIAPYMINGTSKSFLAYEDGFGFYDATTTAVWGANNIVSTSTSGIGNQSAYALKLATQLASSDIFTVGSGGFIQTTGNNGSGIVSFGNAHAYIGLFNGGNQGTNFVGSNGATFYGTGTTFSIGNIGITGGLTFASGSWGLSPNPSGGQPFNVFAPNALTVYSGASLNGTGNSPGVYISSLSGDGLLSTTGTLFNVLINGMSDTGTATFRGLITNGSGTSSVTKAGLNTQVFTNANTYTGATTVNGGKLRLDFSDAEAPVSNIINPTTNTSNLVVGGGTLEVVGKAGTANTQRFNGLTVNAGSSGVTAIAGASGGTMALDLGTLTARVAGGTVNFSSGVALTGGTVVNGVLTSSNTAFATVGGTDWATQTAGVIGALAAYDANDFSAATKNTNVTSTQTAASGFTINTLRFNTADTTLTLAGANTIGTGGILVTSAATGTTISGANIQAGAGNELAVINNGQLTVNSVIAGTAKSLTLSGVGTTTLNGANSYTGDTRLNSGIVVVGNNNAFGTTAGFLQFNGGTIQSSTGVTIGNAISLNNMTTIGGANALTFSGTLTNNMGAGLSGLITVNNTGLTTISGLTQLSGSSFNAASLTIKGSGNVTMSGVIRGGSTATDVASNLLYAGTGTLTLTNAANTYTGATRINGGTVSVATLANGGVASNIGKSTNAALNLSLNGGTLKYTGAAVTTDRLFSLGESGGAIDSSGSGAVNFNNGGLVGLNNIGTGFNNQAGARTLTLTGSNAGDNALAAALADQSAGYATSLTKSGAGNWIVSGASTYTGATTINSGTLTAAGVAQADSSSTGTWASSSNSITLGSTAGLAIGQKISGAGIVPGAIITAINTGTNVVTISVNTTAAGTAAGVNFAAYSSVGAGTVIVNNTGTFSVTGSLLANSPITINSGGTLRGTGSIAGIATFNAGSTLAAGINSATLGTLTFTDSLTTGAGITFSLKLNSATGLSDLIAANGVSLNGATLSLTDLGSTTLALGTTFVLVDNTSANSVAGTFAGLNQGSTVNVGSNTFQISYLGGASGNDIVLTAASAVPEPSTYALLGGVLALGFAAWRSRKRA